MKKRSAAIIIFAAFTSLAAMPAYSLNLLQFRNFVQVSPFADAENWFLTQPLVYDVRDTGKEIIIPDYFVTDFASIPQPFWSILPPWGKYGPPSVVHDFLYWDQRCTREQADRIFLAAMEESKVTKFRRFFIHLAVRWGGAMSWEANKKIRAAGMTREIPESMRPTDPKTEWKELQQAIFNSGYRPEQRPSSDPPPDYCSAAD
ncbi:DUF1353 domain-containing protein [Nitrosospira sp. Nsp18]|uniref:DUF1353 domain-containing protein n=1 Tax=Nitrosospira sp. Nsp18 TaxID=1855334 RepID=UPI0015A401CA|nr:DUF1353 domain-containing protein [Nitrosospira sp. Nsp18]